MVAPNAETLMGPALRHDPSGRAWLPRLLAAAPRGREVLGELVERPGSLEIMLSVAGVSGRLGAFERRTAPPRELLAWYVDHPQALTDATAEDDPAETVRLRRLLLDDRDGGLRARAQQRAREQLPTASPYGRAWWRFEDAFTPECVLMSDRLVVTVVTDATDPLASATPWLPARCRLVRELEAARRLAAGRAFASLLVGGEPEGGLAIEALIAAGTPQLDGASRSELAASFLGRIDWATAETAALQGVRETERARQQAEG